MTVRIIAGDCREVLRTLPAGSVHMCVTSPPYFNLRSYSGGDREIGTEQSPEEYVMNLVGVFREVRRVLRKDGTVWLNLGDSYAGSQKGIGSNGKAYAGPKQATNVGSVGLPVNDWGGLKSKDLCMIPARVALALQSDGWYLRSDIIWAKGVSFCPTYNGSVMPESVQDRPTRSHEYVFLLAKSRKYYFDMEAIKEPVSEASIKRISQPTFDQQAGGDKDYRDGTNPNRSARNTLENFAESASSGRHPRSVWTINPKPYRGAHFACYPPALITPMIKAGSSEEGCCDKCGAPWERVTKRQKHPERDMELQRLESAASPGRTDGHISGPSGMVDVVTTVDWHPTCNCNASEPIPCTILDPFSGAGTTGLVADRLGRDAILMDLNPDYCQIAYDRIKGENPMFTEVTLE